MSSNKWSLFFIILSALMVGTPSAKVKDVRFIHTKEPKHKPSHAYKLADLILETTARDVDRVGARPTIISRQMAMALSAMYEAWSVYDEKAIPAYNDPSKKRPQSERTAENRTKAMSAAVHEALLAQFPDDQAWITAQMHKLDARIKNSSDATVTLGRELASTMLIMRENDGSNHNGKHSKSSGKPYSDYTGYQSVNPPGQVLDPDKWGPLPFADGKGGYFYPNYLTPHFHLVKPFALESGDQFRPGPQPKVGDPQLLKETEEVIQFNASLTLEQKAIVEFMRDGPRSTGQSGHWLKFAQDVSRRDKHNLDQDVKLFFAIGNICMDAFIAAWDAKRAYDSSRPWHLVRHYFKGKTIPGYKGPGQGVGEIPADAWHPYSPDVFITPPFPGYVSGHSTVSAASARILELFTGSDHYGFKEIREAGSLTEEKFPCRDRQKIEGKYPSDMKQKCMVTLDLPTFSATAQMAGISRVMGGYHIQADNIEGLNLGKKVADFSWKVYQRYFEGESQK